MKTKHFFAFATAIALSGTVQSAAQYKSFTMEERAADVRSGQMELYIAGQYWHAEIATAHNVTVNRPPPVTGDVKLELDDAGFLGFGLAYHLNKHLAVSGEFMFGNPDYTMSFQNSRLTGEAFVHTGKFNLEYNILPGRFTPFVSGGVGYFYIDSNVPSGPPDIYCWWDYWWGAVCSDSTPTYKNTYFTANAAVGIRWDIGGMFSVKLYGGPNFVMVDKAVDWLTTAQVTLSAGWKF